MEALQFTQAIQLNESSRGVTIHRDTIRYVLRYTTRNTIHDAIHLLMTNNNR
jgi:hypothetical protein